MVCLVRGGRGSPWSRGGGVPGQGGWGFSLVPGGGWCAWSGGVLLGPGGGSPETPPLLTESQTRVKTQPWPQLRCGR